jgi:hypothetical protein
MSVDVISTPEALDPAGLDASCRRARYLSTVVLSNLLRLVANLILLFSVSI